MPLTTNLQLDLPIVNVTTGPAYATLVNEAFEDIDIHDHTSGRGKRVPSAGINIDNTLEFNNNFITEPKAVKFEDQTVALSTTDDRRGLYSLNGELVYIDGSGNSVPITSAGSLNVSGTGNVTGLAGTTAAITYNNISKNFIFTQSPGVAAAIQADPLYLQDSGSNTVAITSPTTVTTNYVITLPAAAPASANSYLRFDASGNAAFGTFSTTGLSYFSLNQATGVFTLGQVTPSTDIAQGGAVTGQPLSWSGSAWGASNPNSVSGSTGTPTSVASAAALTPATGRKDTVTYVQGDGGAATGVTLSAGSYTGQMWTIVGASDTNTVQITYASGTRELNGDIILTEDDMITLLYDGAAWVEVSRNS